MHARRLRVHGDVGGAEATRDFSPPPDTCRQCGGPRGEGYAKWYCSVRCFGRYYDGVDEGRVWACLECGAEMTSQTNRSDATRCNRCSRIKPFLSARQLAERDGITCGICSEPVDMARMGSRDPSGPAADHIVPRAKGGPNTAENLQLAHFRCNAVKRDKVLTPEWVAALAADARERTAEAPLALLTGTCGAGHPRTSENGRWERTGWACRPCKVARQQARRDAETETDRAARYERENAARRARYALKGGR